MYQYKKKLKYSLQFIWVWTKTEDRLSTTFKKYSKSTLGWGERTRHLVTFNPSTTRSGEEVYIRIPIPGQRDLLVPDTLHLVFQIKLGNTKSHFRNNLSKLLRSRLQIRYASEIVYDNTNESLFEVHRDTWLSESKRDTMYEYGIGSGRTWWKLYTQIVFVLN